MRLNAMRDFHAFSCVFWACLSVTRDSHASCVILTHLLNFTLSLFIGVLAFWRVGITVAAVLSFFELPVAALSVNRALRVFANCWPVMGPCVLDSLALACVCCLFLLPVGNGATD